MDIPALYTVEDMTSGHGPWPPVGYFPPPAGASENVFINSRNVHKVGDQTLPHTHLPPDTHTDRISTGSLTVFVNKKPMAFIGSLLVAGPPINGIPAGQVAALGANSVFIDSKK
jgi:uncharacterized Zn-binding protein involved in type VI secretion